MKIRKSKKAFKAGLQNNYAKAYHVYLDKLAKQKKQALNICLAAFSSAIGLSRIAQIKQTTGISHTDKALAIANTAIETALSIQRLMMV